VVAQPAINANNAVALIMMNETRFAFIYLVAFRFQLAAPHPLETRNLAHDALRFTRGFQVNLAIALSGVSTNAGVSTGFSPTKSALRRRMT